MIITLTLNPSIDKTVEVKKLTPGALNRIKSVTVDAGGKGINVSKMIYALGGSSIATGFLGGSSGETVKKLMDEFGLAHDFVEVQGVTRTNTKVLDSTHGITELNEPGIVADKDETRQLVRKLLSYKNGNIFVLSGSLHLTASTDFYKELIEKLNKKNTVLFDADTESFAQGVEAVPHLIKPNEQELLRYFGKSRATLDELVLMCNTLVQKGITTVVLSLGERGALFVRDRECYHAPGLNVHVSSTVGAGDSMVGAMAYAISLNMNFEDSAKLALASSAGAVTTTGTKPPSPQLVEQLRSSVNLIKLY